MLVPSLALVMLMQLALPPIELTGNATTVPLDATQARALSSLAANAAHTLLLRLDDVVAERSPGIYWEVYVEPRGARFDPNGPYYVGNVVLFGSGIRSEGGASFKPAHFVFPLNAALRAAHRARDRTSSSHSSRGPPPGATARSRSRRCASVARRSPRSRSPADGLTM